MKYTLLDNTKQDFYKLIFFSTVTKLVLDNDLLECQEKKAKFGEKYLKVTMTYSW